MWCIASPGYGQRVTGVVTLLDLRESALSVDECMDAVRSPAAGGIALFVGVVRDEDGGRDVRGLEYSAHPLAEGELRRVTEAVAAEMPVTAVAALHRVGPLEIGDLAVVIAVSSPHRAEAFAACRRLIDDLKEQVPIWKHQLFVDGDAEWVGSP
jgi:molybdopterin synthase catalytic subunit